MSWFVFRITAGGNVCNPADYMLVLSPPSCPGNNKLCAISCPDDGFGNPYISTELLCEMAQAINSGTESTNVRLRT